MPRPLVASAPTRIDLGGGWTDVPPYPAELGGCVCNIAITRRATVQLTRVARTFAATSSLWSSPGFVDT